MSETKEKQYYTNGNVTVTDKRLIVLSQTFAVSGITSVKLGVDSPNRIIPIALILIGFAFTWTGYRDGKEFGFPLLLAIIGCVWLAFQKTIYTVVLATASGETKAVSSKYKKFVEDVVEALNKAIIDR